MATAPSAREARRKRIMDRGSDRLALITGHIHTLPSSPTPEPASPPASQPQELDSSVSSQSRPSILSDQTTVSNGEDKRSRSMFSNLDSRSASGLGSIDIVTARTKPHIHKSEIRMEAFGGPTSDNVCDREEPAVIRSSVENSSATSGSNQWSGHASNQSFRPKKIVSAIRASEITRIVCSVTIALSVVLSHAGFPLLNSNFMKSFIFSRPLFLVLLTNLTVVIGRLLFEEDRGLQRADKEIREVTPEDGYGWAERVGNSLEAGMLLQKIMDAVSMDCSAYALVVITGLSLASKFC